MNTRAYARPRIVVSRCLGFEACRWNGALVSTPFLEKMQPLVDFVTVCPEADIGLGVPRHPIRIIRPEKDGALRLVQPATGADVTDAMQTYLDQFLTDLPEVDGFLLKTASPSCGRNNVKVYKSATDKQRRESTDGFLGGRVAAQFSHLPVEDEGRLRNFILREHFLIRVFTLADFRETRQKESIAELVAFHSRHKYLLMSYNQTAMRQLGKIVANHDHAPIAELWDAYAQGLQRALATPAREGAHINTLEHMAGYFKKQLHAEEKAYFQDILEEYRRGGQPLSVPLSVLKGWALHYQQEYLLQQTFLSPYPQALVEITDSGQGRRLK